MQDFIGFPQGVVTAALLYVIGHRLIGLTWLHRDTLPFQRRLFSIAFVLRFATAFVLYELEFVSFIGDYDGIGWLFGNALRNAWDAAGMGPVDLPSAWLATFSMTNRGYYYLVATLLFFVGSPSRLAVAALNCAIGALTMVFAYRASRSLFSESASTRVAWWMTLFPSMIVWSAQTVKEPVAILLEVIALYGAVAIQRWEFRPRHIVLSVAAVVAIVPFRFYAGYIAAAAIALSMFVPWSHRKQAGPGSGVALAGVVVSLIVVAAMLGSYDVNTSGYDAEFIQQFRYNIAAGTATGVQSTADMRTSTGMALGTVVGALHVLLAPFPWQIGSAATVMVLPELVYWWWLFFRGVLPGLKWGTRGRLVDVLPLLFFMVGLLLVYSMTFGNVGLAYRQRTQMLPWLFMFGAVGLECRAAVRTAQASARPFQFTLPAGPWIHSRRRAAPTTR